MADDLDDGEFWLPSQFLTEEDIPTDFGASTPTTISTTGFNSELGSPGESVTETESDEDEDEFFAELTRRMSRSSLPQDFASTNPKGLVLSGSPQSTLIPVGGSSRGSPTGPVSPPPAKEGYFKADAAASFDLLNAAAGEVAKLRMKREQQQQQKGTGYFDNSRGFLFPPVKQQTSPIPLRSDFHGFFSRQQPFQQLPQICSSLETMKQVNHNTENGDFLHGGRSENHLHNRPLGLPTAAWPPLQRPLNRRPHTPAPAQNLSVTRRESVGTGVFLPRRVDVNPNPNPIESRKIRNKHDSTGRFRGQNNGFHGPRRYSESSNSTTEIRLPSEWTY